ncbi:PHP domain-containing protein [Neptunomonas phycophila]|uniref:PHP domain-containing protein n=1 Tax=Neptunomonas phycophila TaxID=1572645 RepID=UPI001BE74D09|nr:PHP domain-containing protein [Neptunomonas phycophila]MBT3144171.1 PHP domain-containing protein [Neptunomonas phycophila]
MVTNEFDLHTHSSASDGVYTPEELVAQAYQAGVKALALTDHDTVKGCEWLRDNNDLLPQDFRLINGVELTCKYGKQVLHVVGLNIDIASEAIQTHMNKLETLRNDRAQTIALRLVKLGLPDLLTAAYEKAQGGQIGRPHFAQAMVSLGLVDSMAKAFKKYLGAGKPGDVKVEWPELSEVITLIHNAGGVSVLAHPTKYNLTLNKIRYLLAAFAEQGGDAVEISYPGVSKDQQKSLSILVAKHELAVSMGSDFHDPGQTWTRLGAYPPIPLGLSRVTERFLN